MQNQIIETEHANTTQFPVHSVAQEVEKARALSEVQGAILMARQLPRNIEAAKNRIMTASKSMLFAEKAIYAYPRGGSTIMGPSIRAAETLANNWGNLLFGFKTLTQNLETHSSEIMSYCWDLETNTRAERVFKVSHIREKSSGNTVLTSPRDIYEKEANDASRRVRACILSIIPDYITQEMIMNCEQTLLGKSDKTLEERISELISNFASIGITEMDLKSKMGVEPNKFVAKNIVYLGHIYNSIKDGFAPASQFFKLDDKKQKEINETLKKIRGKKDAQAKQEQLLQPRSE